MTQFKAECEYSCLYSHLHSPLFAEQTCFETVLEPADAQRCLVVDVI